jgi:hypothetical protein
MNSAECHVGYRIAAFSIIDSGIYAYTKRSHQTHISFSSFKETKNGRTTVTFNTKIKHSRMEEPSAEDKTKAMDVPKEEEDPVLTAEAEDQQDDAVEKTEEDAVAESVAEGTETTDAVAPELNMAESKEQDMRSESEKDVKEILDDVNLQDQLVQENSSSSLEKSSKFETDSSADSDPAADHSSVKRVRTRASGMAQVLAMMRKNVLTKFRSPAATFFELFSPVIMMLILAAAYTLSEVAQFDADIYVNPVLNFPGPWVGLIQRSADLFGSDFNLNSALGGRRKLAEENLLQTSSSKKMPSSWEGIFEGLQDKLENAMKGHAKNLAADELDEGYARRLQSVRNQVDTSDDEQAASYKLLDEADDEVCDHLKWLLLTSLCVISHSSCHQSCSWKKFSRVLFRLPRSLPTFLLLQRYRQPFPLTACLVSFPNRVLAGSGETC